jgi:hypothetical protein
VQTFLAGRKNHFCFRQTKLTHLADRVLKVW